MIDFGLVKKMKVAMFVGLFDNTCNVMTATQIRTQLGNAVAMWNVSPMQGHVPWGLSSSPWFIGKIFEAVSINADI